MNIDIDSLQFHPAITVVECIEEAHYRTEFITHQE